MSDRYGYLHTSPETVRVCALRVEGDIVPHEAGQAMRSIDLPYAMTGDEVRRSVGPFLWRGAKLSNDRIPR